MAVIHGPMFARVERMRVILRVLAMGLAVVVMVVLRVVVEGIVSMYISGNAVLVTRARREKTPLGAEHPEADADDESPGTEREVRLHAPRDEPRRSERGEHGHQDDPAGVRQGDKDAEDEGVDGPAAHADDVRGSDRLSMSGRGRVDRPQPEARHQVQNALCPVLALPTSASEIFIAERRSARSPTHLAPRRSPRQVEALPPVS